MYKLRLAFTIMGFVLLSNYSATATPAYQSSNLKPGDAAPSLNLRKILQAPAQVKADKESLRGNIVVLEFWATWCAPCIAAMPHLNDLADKFKNKPVRFISITHEDEAVVMPFLKRRPIKTWIGLDAHFATVAAYAAESIPKTILIDAAGKIAAIIQPKQLTEEMLNDLLSGKPVDIADGESIPSDSSVPAPQPQEDSRAVFSLAIRPIQAITKGWSIDIGRIEGQMSVRAALSLVYGVSRTRIVGPSFLKERYYEITASMTEGSKDAFNLIVGRAIEATCKIKTRREMREVEVYVLSAPNQGEIKLRPNTSAVGHSSDDEGVLAGSAVPIGSLTNDLENVLKEPVIDETGLKGKYDWDIVFDAKDPQTIAEAIQKELGLELKRMKRRIEILVVEAE